mmetsp:Transcript_13743/g.47932  ORF Transcript_13743/g.47932 Transcript_13743/m.47932 type:complete len:158 (-) Transcript_13743:54-527(-)
MRAHHDAIAAAEPTPAGVASTHARDVSPGRRRGTRSPVQERPAPSRAPMPAGEEPEHIDGRLLAAGAVRATQESGAHSRHDVVLKLERLTGSASGHSGHAEIMPAVERRLRAFEAIEDRRSKLRRRLGLGHEAVAPASEPAAAGGAASRAQPKTFIE